MLQLAERIQFWFERHSWPCVFLLMILPFFLTLPLALLHLSINPIWQQSWTSIGVQPGYLPGLSYGDPNFGWTSQALGHLAAEDWIHGTVPWWNPYSGIGLPLAGEMQPGALFLPFVLWLLLSNGVLWLKISIEIIAGVATYALIRELGMGRMAALVAAALFEMNGTFAWTPGPVAVVSVIAFLPLLICGIEKCRKPRQRTFGVILIATAIAGSLYAGFPEEAFINGLLGLIWAIYRYITDFWSIGFLLSVLIGGVLGLLTSAPILVAFFDYLFNSTALGSHQLGHEYLPIKAFGTIVMPYLYGPFADAHGSRVISGIWGSVGGYIGIMLVFMALCGVKGRSERGLRILLAFWIVLAIAKSFGLQPAMYIFNHIPMLVDALFFRYSPPSWEFATIVLVAFALDDLRFRDIEVKWPIMASIVLLFVCAYINWPRKNVDSFSVELIKRLRVLFFLNFAWALIGVIVLTFLFVFLHGRQRRRVFAGILVFNAMVFYVVPELSAVKPGHIDRRAIHYLKNHTGLHRFFTMGPVEPNYSAYFGIQSINYNYLPIETKWFNYVSRNLFPDVKKTAGVIFWPPQYRDGTINTVIAKIRNYEEMGVKYIIMPAGVTPEPVVRISTRDQGNVPLVLEPGRGVRVSTAAPGNSGESYKITGIGIFQGDYGETADGKLHVRLCTISNCVSGNRRLAYSTDNSMFRIHFMRPITVRGRGALRIAISHVGGTKPEALWLWPSEPRYPQRITDGNDQKIFGKSIKMELLQMNAMSIRRVYADKIMDIYRLPHPKSYYSFPGSDCSVISATLNYLNVYCTHSATIVRRELYMPGWTVKDNGRMQSVVPDHAIFQKIEVTAGVHHVVFRFTPPYMRFGWLAFFCGLVGLAVVALFLLFSTFRIFV